VLCHVFQAHYISFVCSAFGDIKKIRMPKKFDGTARGFAFITFVLVVMCFCILCGV
jgi:hypothetical protein